MPRAGRSESSATDRARSRRTCEGDSASGVAVDADWLEEQGQMARSEFLRIWGEPSAQEPREFLWNLLGRWSEGVVELIRSAK